MFMTSMGIREVFGWKISWIRTPGSSRRAGNRTSLFSFAFSLKRSAPQVSRRQTLLKRSAPFAFCPLRYALCFMLYAPCALPSFPWHFWNLKVLLLILGHFLSHIEEGGMFADSLRRYPIKLHQLTTRVELFYFSYPVKSKAYFTGAHTISPGASYGERSKRV